MERARRQAWISLVATAVITSLVGGTLAVFGLAHISWVWLWLGTAVLSAALVFATATLGGAAQFRTMYLWIVVALLVTFLIGVWAYQLTTKPKPPPGPVAVAPPTASITSIKALRGRAESGQYVDNVKLNGVAARLPPGSVLWVVLQESGSYYPQQAVDLGANGRWHATASVGFTDDKPGTSYHIFLVLARDAATEEDLYEGVVSRALVKNNSLTGRSFTLD